jgi:hypothetical protein
MQFVVFCGHMTGSLQAVCGHLTGLSWSHDRRVRGHMTAFHGHTTGGSHAVRSNLTGKSGAQFGTCTPKVALATAKKLYSQLGLLMVSRIEAETCNDED